MRASILVQGPSEDLPAFVQRLNEELARLGDAVKEVQMSSGIHEVTIAGRLSMPRTVSSVLILYEDAQA